MLTLNTIRSAVLSDQPWNRLDELVRAEMALGRKVKEIAAELGKMVDEVWDTPGISENGSDAFGDTLDALTGNCHRDCQYYDPPNTTLPTEEEIAKLPRWARVAFAARCARRVLRLLPEFWADIAFDDLQTVENSVVHAEKVASTGLPDETIASGFRLGAVDGAHHISARAQTTEGNAAALVALAAASAMYTGYLDMPAVRASEAANRSQHAASQMVPAILITQVIRRDFDHLAELAEARKWTDDTPVPPEVFGPLWPEGPPKGWPSVTDAPPRADLPIALFPRERKELERIVEDEAVNLFNALNRYHIARSGVRLTLETLASLLPALVPAEA